MTDKKKSRFTVEQIIGFIKQAEAGMPIKELCRKGGVSDATFYKWRAKFGGMDVPDAKRLRELDGENAKLKRLLAGLPGHASEAAPRVAHGRHAQARPAVLVRAGHPGQCALSIVHLHFLTGTGQPWSAHSDGLKAARRY